MDQHAMPFFDSAEAATKHAIDASGKGYKAVATALFPDRGVEGATTLLRNALNENRAERLTTDQHVFIANFLKRYDWLFYVAHQCQHSQPTPLTPEDEQAKLQRQFVEAIANLEKIQQGLAANKVRLQSVR